MSAPGVDQHADQVIASRLGFTAAVGPPAAWGADNGTYVLGRWSSRLVLSVLLGQQHTWTCLYR